MDSEILILIENLLFRFPYYDKYAFGKLIERGCNVDYYHPQKGTILHALFSHPYATHRGELIEWMVLQVLKKSKKHIHTKDPVDGLEPLTYYLYNHLHINKKMYK